MSSIHAHSFKTPFGTMRCAVSYRGLTLLALPGCSEPEWKQLVVRLAPGCSVEQANPLCRQVEREILDYCVGKRREFSLPLDLRTSPFCRTVLEEVARIPYGETRTYAEIAAAVGKPTAVRAVGGANARNPIPLVIPCHRVVAAGGLGGYGGGLDMKRRLLTLEGAQAGRALMR